MRIITLFHNVIIGIILGFLFSLAISAYISINTMVIQEYLINNPIKCIPIQN